jgi:nitroreductase
VSPEPGGDFDAFKRVVRARRSVRAFLTEIVPDGVIDECLDLALLAPNSQNLHPWEFIRVQTPQKLELLRVYCLDQPPARSAPTLLVAVARPDFWRLARRLNLEHLEHRAGPAEYIRKYKKIIPLIFDDGPLHMLGPLKHLALAVQGLWHPTWRGPFGYWGQQLWATKTTALACENLMLAFRAAGYDTCPMEGFDEPRVKHLLDLPREARVVMVLAVGRRAPGGVTEQLRFDRALFVKRV